MPAEFLFLDPEGNRISLEPGGDWGEAVLLVAPVTDALKSVGEGIVTGPLDRERIVAVEIIGLSSELVERLPVLPKTFEEIYRAVVDLGFMWESRPLPVNQALSGP